jgi:hypothetical protein
MRLPRYRQRWGGGWCPGGTPRYHVRHSPGGGRWPRGIPPRTSRCSQRSCSPPRHPRLPLSSFPGSALTAVADEKNAARHNVRIDVVFMASSLARVKTKARPVSGGPGLVSAQHYFTIMYATPPSTNTAGTAHRINTGMVRLLWLPVHEATRHVIPCSFRERGGTRLSSAKNSNEHKPAFGCLANNGKNKIESLCGRLRDPAAQ